MLMNLMDSLGTVMPGSGLEDMLKLVLFVYGSNTVSHVNDVMSGKAFAKSNACSHVCQKCLDSKIAGDGIG